MQNFEISYSFIAALTGDADNTPVNFRALHDTDKGAKPRVMFDTLANVWAQIVALQNEGYGIFCNVNQLDGCGFHLENVAAIRAHVVDLDNLSAWQNMEAASAWNPAPSLGVQSSPGKFHMYWFVKPYIGNDFYSFMQRKLRQIFDGDKAVIDASRVMRLPGTLHLKNPSAPHLVTSWPIGQPTTVEALQQVTQHIDVTEAVSVRHDLGEPSLAAPSLDWLKYALKVSDPNTLDRPEWIAFMSAFKQAGSTLATEDELYAIWAEWCAQYDGNDDGENLKQWRSIRQTQLGWKSIEARVPAVKAMMQFGGTQREVSNPLATNPESPETAPSATPALPAPPEPDCSGELLTPQEQAIWFKGCYFITEIGKIMTPDNRFLGSTQFNGLYGGKEFVISSKPKVVNEAWQAATRGTLWSVPKVDHVRFFPHLEHSEIFTDDLGRSGINIYKPPMINSTPGDVSPFLRHLELIMPVENDRRILLDYLAHNIKYPGRKIPWAPVIQSAEGAGKGVFKALVRHCMGQSYTHFPNAKELADSGSKFNAWMRHKTFILADEIKVDDRRDMIEVLKPMITEEHIEVQAKGFDQKIEDNFSNWAFFSNYKDCIPTDANSRRFALFFLAIQSAADMSARGMGDAYFKALYDWLRGDGLANIAHYFQTYDIAEGGVPMRAPDTSSTAEAVVMSRTPLEALVIENSEANVPGFCGGWVSCVAVQKAAREQGMRRPQTRTVQTILEKLGYVRCGKAPRAYFQEGTAIAELYHFGNAMDVAGFAAAQPGYG